MSKEAAKHEDTIASLQKQMNGVEGKLGKFGAAHEEVIRGWPQVQKGVQANAKGVASANSKISTIEQKIKDTLASVDGLSSTVASKCSNQASQSKMLPEKPNFALRCAGAYVEAVTIPGASFLDSLQDTVHRLTGISFDHDNPQYNVLDSNNEPGQCWCFAGQQANLTVQLITPMVPTEFFLHHIKMGYYTQSKIDMATAAPKDFTVVGINKDGESVLGDYTYDAAGQKQKGLTQLFTVHQNQGKVFDSMKVVFRESNWSPGRKYTCVYQVGVHGTGALPLDN